MEDQLAKFHVSNEQGKSARMNSAICTLFEGHYHLGVGALANSLYAQGFRGTIYVGYRGSLPLWVANTKGLDCPVEYSPVEGLTLRFIPLTTQRHFTNYKPDFMLQLWEKQCPEAEALFYFDPDIVVRCRWSFFEEWANCGVGLCQEITMSDMPADHPFRAVWRKLAESMGYPIHRNLSRLYNGGFVAVNIHNRSFLDVWNKLLDAAEKTGVPLENLSLNDATHPFNVPDQMCLNIAAMIADVPLSTVGPEEMDFLPGGSYMSHATCTPKPWRKQFALSALQGIPPSRPEKAFWQRTQFPIRLFSKPTLIVKQFDLRLASAVSRFIRRN